MLQKGSMIQVKKVLGALLLVMGVGFALSVEMIKNVVMNYPVISIGVLLGSGYFLVISGRQR